MCHGEVWRASGEEKYKGFCSNHNFGPDFKLLKSENVDLMAAANIAFLGAYQLKFGTRPTPFARSQLTGSQMF